MMCRCLTALLTALAATGVAALSSSACKQIQYPFPTNDGNATRLNAVREAYLQSWNEYEKYCFGEDEILPLTKECTNDLAGFGATIIDGMDTAIIMNLTDVVARQLEHAATVDFTKSDVLVELFDMIIRYVAGLLSAYDLLKSGMFYNNYPSEHIDALLSQAKTLAEQLKPCFDTETGLPTTFVNYTTKLPSPTAFTSPLDNITYNSTNTAQAGTIILEFSRLSDLTGDPSFRELAARAESYLTNPKPAPPFPGLVGTQLDTATGNFIIRDGGWKSGVDSFLEYLVKTHVYNPSDDANEEYKDFWLTAADSSQQNIAVHPYGFPDLTFLSNLDDFGNLNYRIDDYTCFAGGNLLYGGAYFDRPDLKELGAAVTDGCHQTYNTTVTGLGPLFIDWYSENNKAYNSSYDNDATLRSYAAKNGYFIEPTSFAASYRSFPETIESIFYAWRITGDPRWREYNWEIFNALNKTRTPEVPYVEIADVNAADGGAPVNYLSTYYFAETLKYLFLSFSNSNVLSLDQWVFNTECHPVKILGGTCAVEAQNIKSDL